MERSELFICNAYLCLKPFTLFCFIIFFYFTFSFRLKNRPTKIPCYLHCNALSFHVRNPWPHCTLYRSQSSDFNFAKASLVHQINRNGQTLFQRMSSFWMRSMRPGFFFVCLFVIFLLLLDLPTYAFTRTRLRLRC